MIDHVEADPAEDLHLGELADIAGFPSFHLNRIFHALVGETLGGFVGRIPVEQALK